MTAVNYQPLLVLWKDLWKGYSSFLPSLFILKKICLNNISRVFHCNICMERFYKIIKTDTIFPFTLSPISLASRTTADNLVYVFTVLFFSLFHSFSCSLLLVCGHPSVIILNNYREEISNTLFCNRLFI